jgi:UDP-glucuronate 4-epimerase
MAIYKFTKKIFDGEVLSIYGKGDSKRDYTYIDDVVCGIISSTELKEVSFETFNIGSGKPISIINLVKIIENKCQKKAKIKYVPSKKGDMKITYANIQKAKKILNYEPKTNIEKGIETFISWYKNKKL